MSTKQPDQPIINIRDEKVALGPIRRDLLPLYEKWINDFEVTRTLGIGMHPMTSESEEEWYQRVAKGDGQSVSFTIYEITTSRPIGNTSLFDIDHIDQKAELGIMIGEKDCWDKGYGTETTVLMLDYGFSTLNLHNIMLRVYSYNERGIAAYQRAGFKVMGRRREVRWLGGRAYDAIWMDCLATEFKSMVLRKLLPNE